MSDNTDLHKIGGSSAHVADCYVWAEIYYLDSPTDYREYLPGRRPIDAICGADFELLKDDSPTMPQYLMFLGLLVIFPALLFVLYLFFA